MIRIRPALASIALLISGLVATVPMPALGAGAAHLEAVLRHRGSVTVEDAVVRLGDLFDGAGAKADVAVAYSPEPGRRIVFDARWLYRIARAHGLRWRPQSRIARTVVERDSRVVEGSMLEDHILSALADEGVAVDGRRVVFGRLTPKIHLPSDADAELTVERVAYDTHQDRFAVVFVAAGATENEHRVRLTGALREMTDVPVLVRRVPAGEIIRSADIEHRTVPTESLPRDTVFEVADLIGRTPRRGVRAGAPVRGAEIRSPIVVSRGELVTIIVALPQMVLTARGRALDDGGRRDVVRVRNLDSKGIVEGRISGPGQVVVDMATDIIAE